MRFTVPKFIEREPKIIGPLTFKQFMYLAIAGGICFILYFLVSLPTFILLCIILMGGASALSFIQIGGRSLPAILAIFLKFNISPKMFIWRKKEPSAKIYTKENIQKENETKDEEETPLTISARSRLKKIQTQIETHTQ